MRPRSLVKKWLFRALLLCAALPIHAAEPTPKRLIYAVDFEVRVIPTERAARVTIRLGEGASLVDWFRFRIDEARHREFAGDGEVIIEGDTVEWRPPNRGGALSYVFSIDQLRNERAYDARCSKRWAIFRGGDLIPPARISTTDHARSRSRLHLQLPEGWSAALPYSRTPQGYYPIQHASRNFDRPVGWMVLGKIGVLRERIDGVKVSVAGPTGHDLNRLDILTLLRWNLPTTRIVFGGLPETILIVGAGDPMWRGGLSGANSVFIHADRPLISDDASSPIMHELVHMLMDGVPGPGGDWIAEGFAELYSIEVLRRSGTLSQPRFDAAIGKLERRSAKGGKLRVRSVTGDTTAKAVITLRALDVEIRNATEGARSLDDLLRAIVADSRDFTTSRLQAHAEAIAGRSLQAFFDRYVPAPSPRKPLTQTTPNRR